jgi:endonuclease/exonuclease/phosphatase family metal-dependent hydrolase
MKSVKLFSLISLLILSAATFAGCDKDNPKVIKSITVSDEQSLNQEVFADKTSGSGVTFTTTGAWTTSIAEASETSAAPAWLSISPSSSGDKAGTYTLVLTLEQNFTGSDRTAVITIVCADTEIAVTITQKSVKEDGKLLVVEVEISPLSHEFAATTALTAYSAVVFSPSKPFTASSSEEWCTAVVNSGVAKNLKITVTPNELFDERTAVISLLVNDVARPEVVTVTQAGADRVIVAEERGVYLNGSSQAFTLHLRADVPCTVQLPDWVQRAGSSGEIGSGEYSFTAEALAGDERRDSIIFHPTGPFSVKAFAIPIVQMNVATLNVMTYNIRVLSGSDGLNGWSYRRTSALKIIRLEDIDIVGTQETEPDQHNYLKENLTAYEAYGVGREDGKSNGEHNTLFYRKDRFTAHDQGTFWLSQTPDTPGKGWDAAYTRIASWVVLEDKISGIRFFYINTHIEWNGAEAQKQSIPLLMNKINELRGSMPVILTGDFNMPPTNANIKYITDVVNNPYPLVHTKTVADVFTGFEGSFHAYKDTDPGPGQLIDYVFVDENAKVLLHKVIPPKLDGIFLSDHAPVTAKIRID